MPQLLGGSCCVVPATVPFCMLHHPMVLEARGAMVCFLSAVQRMQGYLERYVQAITCRVCIAPLVSTFPRVHELGDQEALLGTWY